jgi:type IV pilus assembly protein PilM
MAFGMIGTTPVFAVDFGVASLKALQLSADSKQIIAAAMVETPIDLRLEHSRRFEFQSDALPKLLRGAGIKGRRAVCSIPASQTYVHHFRVPRQDDVPLDTAVGAELLAHTHCDPARVVFRSIPVRGAVQSSSKIETICIALARDLVLKQIAAFKKLKIETVGVFSEHLAMHAACLAMTDKTNEAAFPTLHLDISATSTKAIITHSGKLVFAKTIGIGGSSFDQSIARHHQCGQIAAHAMRLGGSGGRIAADAGEPVAVADPREIESRCAEQIEALTDEISMCLRYHRQLFPDDPVCRAILFGGETRSKSLCHAVARSLRLPTQIADPFARLGKDRVDGALGVDLSQPQPGWATPMGLTLLTNGG